MKRIAAFALTLAACTGSGGEPSADELREALRQSGNRGAAKAEKLACKTSPDRPGQVCDYRAPACNRFTGTCGAVRPFTARFLHADGRWQLVEDLTAKAAPDPATQPLPGVVLATPVPTASSASPPAVTAAPTDAPGAVADAPDLSRRDLRLIGRWRALDARCREDADDLDACDERADTAERLRRRDLCYGPPGAFGYDRAWRRCAP